MNTLPTYFARRMLPLVLVVGLVVAAVPPISYRLIAWHQLAVQARTYARQMAAAVRRAAEEDPYLWRYNSAKVVSAVAGYRGQQDLGSVSMRDCQDRPILSRTELGLGTGEAGPRGEARVVTGAGAIAVIEVQMGTHAQRRILWALAAVAALIGGALSLALYVLPTRVVRRQASEVTRTLRQLEAVEAELRQLNQHLARRVDEAVSETRQLSQRMVTLQEEERQRIARDLHDGVGQAVTALQIALRLGQDHPQESPARLAEASRLAEDILGEIRTAVFALRPVLTAGLGIGAGLRACVERFEMQTRTPASLRTQGELCRISEKMATCLLRITQEALTNVSRHATASEVGVLLQVYPDRVALQVADDGRGLGAQDESRGCGLRGMRERAAFLGGELQIKSEPGEGTVIEVSLPLDEGSNARKTG